MKPSDTARTIALGRVAAGVAFIVAPKLAARWLGRDVVESGGGQVAVRALGIRDLILGAITLHTISHPEVAPRWVATCAAADAVDAFATIAARDKLPAKGVPTAVLAVGSAAAGFAASRRLKSDAA